MLKYKMLIKKHTQYISAKALKSFTELSRTCGSDWHSSMGSPWGSLMGLSTTGKSCRKVVYYMCYYSYFPATMITWQKKKYYELMSKKENIMKWYLNHTITARWACTSHLFAVPWTSNTRWPGSLLTKSRILLEHKGITCFFSIPDGRYMGYQSRLTSHLVLLSRNMSSNSSIKRITAKRDLLKTLGTSSKRLINAVSI